jgi:hypothetical protein
MVSQGRERAKPPKFLLLAIGISAKLIAALILLAVVQNHYALDIRISHVRPLINVQLIVLDNLPHVSISSLLKFAGDFLSRHF